MSHPKPLYVHDCDCCRFLGTVSDAGAWGGRGEWGDMYVCERIIDKAARSVIFRTGNGGRDYTSMRMSLVHIYPESHPIRIAALLYKPLA